MSSKIRAAREVYGRYGLIELFKVSKSYLADRLGLYKLNRYRYRLQYCGAIPQATKVIRIDPGDVTYKTVPSLLQAYTQNAQHIVGGEWDRSVYTDSRPYGVHYNEVLDRRHLAPFEDTILYTSLHDRFNEGLSLDETEFYDYLQRKLDEDERIYRYETEAKIQERFEEIEALYEDIKQNGYKTQHELRNRDTEIIHDSNEKSALNEVMVDIGRDGELIFEHGHHRFTIARVLGLSDIPVRVLCRHSKWQQKRCSMASATDSEELDPELSGFLDHPDMLDVAPNPE